MTLILNVVALGALCVPVWQLSKLNVSRLLAPPLPLLEVPRATRRPDPLPDIYYVILDRYASRDTLARRYGLDNQPFYDFLRSRGFYVAEASSANYPKTALSLASSLNMSYLDDLERTFGRDQRDWQPIYDYMAKNRLVEFLHQQGYTYVHLGSWWWPTRVGRRAERNIEPWCFPASFYLLLNRTMLAPFVETGLISALDFNYRHWRQTHIGFDELHKLLRQPGPKFVFAHFLGPHEPFVLRPDGTLLAGREAKRLTWKESYWFQLLGLNRLIERWVDQALAESAVPPVIVLQSDEGPYPADYRTPGRRQDWRQASLQDLREKSGILYAVYLPDRTYQHFNPQITPVNTFRVILDQYFGTHLGRLPDRVFIFESEMRPLAFIEITRQIWDQPPLAQRHTGLGTGGTGFRFAEGPFLINTLPTEP
ncbi:MAG: LTA synthase family protein [Firmicutes bacterium]|nr:LTA synthase family protein [Bacillota bacterium]